MSVGILDSSYPHLISKVLNERDKILFIATLEKILRLGKHIVYFYM